MLLCRPIRVLALSLVWISVCSAQSPWTSFDSFRRTGYTSGEFQGKTQDTGNFEHKIDVYRLDSLDSDTVYDWFRVDMSITSTITSYRKGDSVCGWYTDWAKAAFALETSGGEIVDIGPETTTTSGSKFISMGGNLSATGPAIQAGYQYAQVVPDEGIRLVRDAPRETAYWIASLRGCKGGKGASGVAKSTYSLKPSVIVRVPEGANLRFKTKTDDAVNGFKHEKDKLQLSANPLDTDVDRYSFVKQFSYEVICGSAGCTFNSK